MRRLLIAPDGKLTLVPFGLLCDVQGQRLSSRAAVSYLTCGREVARETDGISRGRGVVVMAAPDFDADTAERVPTTPVAFADRGALAPLAGMREEGEDLARLLDHVTLLTGPEATVKALRTVQHPVVLHLATHGIFAPMHEIALHWSTDILSLAGEVVFLSQSAPVAENPMFFSGLALAGANRHGHGAGILTAQEIAGLELRGTELVVLSACETGLGTIKDGEEFTGLRRALAIAGAATQVTSLWKVNDDATRALMGQYYRLLLDDHGRAEALALAQECIANDPAHPEWCHPFYWAAFVSAGAWGPMGHCLRERRTLP